MFKPSKDFKETSTKVIYFVRHGQSSGNISNVRQGGLASLTDHGRKQAEKISARCARIPAEIIISSTMTRAKETVEYILEKLKKPMEYSDLFIERRRPSVQTGKPKDTPEALHADKVIIENFAKPGFRFSDEENFDDLKKRARDALTYLAQRPEKNILVVTHGFFMRVLAAYAVLGENLSGHECQAFIRSFPLENTGITVFLHDKKDEHPWAIWTWNDHSHLG